jgi:hypothetical protein
MRADARNPCKVTVSVPESVNVPLGFVGDFAKVNVIFKLRVMNEGLPPVSWIGALVIVTWVTTSHQ